MVELETLSVGETAEDFKCPDCSSNVEVMDKTESSFEYLCHDCQRQGTQFV